MSTLTWWERLNKALFPYLGPAQLGPFGEPPLPSVSAVRRSDERAYLRPQPGSPLHPDALPAGLAQQQGRELSRVVRDGDRPDLFGGRSVAPTHEDRGNPVRAGPIDIVVAVAHHDRARQVRAEVGESRESFLHDVGLGAAGLVVRGPVTMVKYLSRS